MNKENFNGLAINNAILNSNNPVLQALRTLFKEGKKVENKMIENKCAGVHIKSGGRE